MKIVFHGANASAFEPGFASLLERPHDMSVVSDAAATAAERDAIASAEVLIGVKLDATVPEPERLRLYHAPAAGTDAIDRSRLPPAVPLCNAYGHEYAIAEYVIAAVLNRFIPFAAADRDLRKGKWTLWPGRPNTLRREMGDSTMGLLGFGHIGKAVAARAKAFGMRVAVANRSPVASSPLVDQSFGLDQLPEFMASADTIVVSLPLLPESRGIVGAEAFAAMRPDAVIINVGRGPVIDQTALYEALKGRRIGGAVIDTWYAYPADINATMQPARLPFHELDNIVMTPHMSAWTTGTIRRRQQTMADNINRLQRGEALINVIGGGSV
jgi:phosphoglycerate dehydrogenase-like enzyme